jgi:hypothetical protein
MSITRTGSARKGEKDNKPPLPADAVILPSFASQVISRESDRPSQPYLDVTFLDTKKGSMPDAEAIMFQNYYTSSISIYMHVTTLSSTTYLPLLMDRSIMPSPYSEEGSQDWVTIPIAELDKKYVAGRPLRITLAQPNTAQKTYEIRHLHVVAMKAAATTAIGGRGMEMDDLSLTSSSDNNNNNNNNNNETARAWNTESLTSIIKAEAHFLAGKAVQFRDSAEKENERIDTVIRMRNDSDATSRAKAKKKKSASSSATGPGAAAGGSHSSSKKLGGGSGSTKCLANGGDGASSSKDADSAAL